MNEEVTILQKLEKLKQDFATLCSSGKDTELAVEIPNQGEIVPVLDGIQGNDMSTCSLSISFIPLTIKLSWSLHPIQSFSCTILSYTVQNFLISLIDNCSLPLDTPQLFL